MRTRFLNTDYFSSRSPIEALSRFQFIPLPPPSDLSAPDPSPGVEIPISGLGLDLPIPFEIDPFPIENALSQFLSDVIPNIHPAAEEGGSFRASTRKRKVGSEPADVDQHEKSGAGFYDVEDHEISGAPDSGVSDQVPILIHEEDIDDCLDLMSVAFLDKNSEGNELQEELLFEIVEVDLPLGDSMVSFKAEEARIHFEIPNITIPADNIDIDVEVKVIYPHKVAKSTYLVDEIYAKFDEQEFSSFKVSSSSTDRTLYGNLVLPHFEVHENYLDTDAGIANAEVFSCMLPIIESCVRSQVDEFVINANEFLESSSVDIMEDISGNFSMDNSCEEKPMSLSSILELDILNLGDIMLLERGSAIYPIAANGNYSHLPCSVHFEEVQNFDFPSDDVMQIVVSSQPAKTLDMSELIAIDDIYLDGTPYQSFVSTELALVDDTFISLPTPILSDDKATKSMSMIFEELLHAIKPHSLSACDEIYLDWHPLLEGTCNRESCYSYMNMLHDVSTYGITSELQTDCAEILSTDIDFFDDFRERVDTLQSKELPTELCRSIPHVTYPSTNTETPEIRKNGTLIANDVGSQPHTVSEKSSLLFESMSQSNDLNFFLDVRRGKSVGNYRDQTVKISNKQITPPIALFQEPSVPCVVPKENLSQWIIDVHSVSLSDHILCLMEHIQKTYLAILEESPYLKKSLLQITNDSRTLCLPKQKLLNLIISNFAKQCTSDSSHEDFMTSVALYGVKQLAFFLCFFGVHAAHLYISYLVRNVNNIAERLSSLESLLEDVCWKSDKQLIELHPSLSVIEGILMSNIQNSDKILIIAERVFWLSLGQKLASMQIKFHAVNVDHPSLGNLNKIDSTAYENSLLEGLQNSDCLLASYENVSASFPFNKFCIILEYGGPYVASRLPSLSRKSDGLPRVHFIHVEIEKHLAAIALFEGPDACEHPESTREATSQFMPNVEQSLNNIIEILNFVPTEEKKNCLSLESANQTESSSENETLSIPYSVGLKNVDSRAPCFPDVVVIVNTQSSKKKMLISRRTSYQKILTMEKAGLQVVERDVDLPLDLIFNAAVCLIWYEARNFVDKKATRVEDSHISMLVENIATSVLMSLSFSFSACMLIFEGESSFLSAVMESSDALYAAAASLDMNLQLFCSHDPDSTDNIILSCIKTATRSTRGVYPAMPESESIGESFLTRFPSINPLSAQAILSSGGSLVEFLEWSNERRIQAIGKYHVPEESISLFSALCRYGEVGESKSVMTECSSIDSDINSGLLPSPRKRKRHACHTLPSPFLAEPLNQNIRPIEKPPKFQKYQLRNFVNIQEKMRKIESNYSNDMLGRRPCGSTICGNDLNSITRDDYMSKEFIDEIDGQDFGFLDEKFSLAADTFNFLEDPESGSEAAIVSSHTTSRQPISTKGHSMFPISAEINHDANKTSSLKDHYLNFNDRIFKHQPMCSRKDDVNQEYQKENFMQDHINKTIGLSSQEKVPPAYDANPFSNATQPSRLEGHRWFTDILHRLKEKGSTRQQTHPRNPCFNCTRICNLKDTPSKSQSPSVIDTYRYKGSNQMNTTKHNWKKDVKRQSGSNKECKGPCFITRTWTPIDKKARQNLSFIRNGNEKQSKLVWRSRNSPNIGCSTRKRYRDEGSGIS